ncbi:20606_t:CDS:2, partial [Gigaspora margarita]
NIQPLYIQDHNLQNAYDTSNIQFFYNNFDNYQGQVVQKQDVQALHDYLLDVLSILPLENNSEEIYNNVADL